MQGGPVVSIMRLLSYAPSAIRGLALRVFLPRVLLRSTLGYDPTPLPRLKRTIADRRDHTVSTGSTGWRPR